MSDSDTADIEWLQVFQPRTHFVPWEGKPYTPRPPMTVRFAVKLATRGEMCPTTVLVCGTYQGVLGHHLFYFDPAECGEGEGDMQTVGRYYCGTVDLS